MSQVEVRTRPTVVAAGPTRYAFADNLKVLLVVGVIAGHVTLAYSDVGTWVLREAPVRDPLLGLLRLIAVVGAMFAMALFFMIAGYFTPRSLARKGLRRFLADRALRLGVPMLFFIVVLAPVVEFVDSDNLGWDRGFVAFIPHTWRNIAPGPTWFLGVLLLFSVVYAFTRAVVPRRTTTPTPMRARCLIAAALFIAVASYGIRVAVPFGEEFWHLALGQAPSWLTGFVLGVVGAERGWFEHMTPVMSRRLFRIAWAAVAGVVLAVGIAATGGDDAVDLIVGGGTWQSLVVTVIEGALVVAMCLWLYDVFRRRVNHQGSLLRALSRAAFAAFLVHQVVAVGAILLTHHVGWPPEVEYVLAGCLAVAGSFGVGALLVRAPGLSRIV